MCPCGLLSYNHKCETYFTPSVGSTQCSNVKDRTVIKSRPLPVCLQADWDTAVTKCSASFLFHALTTLKCKHWPLPSQPIKQAVKPGQENSTSRPVKESQDHIDLVNLTHLPRTELHLMQCTVLLWAYKDLLWTVAHMPSIFVFLVPLNLKGGEANGNFLYLISQEDFPNLQCIISCCQLQPVLTFALK